MFPTNRHVQDARAAIEEIEAAVKAEVEGDSTSAEATEDNATGDGGEAPPAEEAPAEEPAPEGEAGG
jgi:hypothetical protein